MKKLIYSMLVLALIAMTFVNCENVPAPYNTPTKNEEKPQPADPKGTGTQADPFNVTAAHNFIKAGIGLDKEVYVKGKIVSVKEVDGKKYGNATYYISDDGTVNNQLEVFRGFSLGKVKFKTEGEIKAGDEVIVCGKLIDFNGTHEFTQGNYIYSLNGKTAGGSSDEGDPQGSGTQADPYNVAAALKTIKALKADVNSDDMYVKGKIVSINKIDLQYGNATYYISDDGTEKNQLYIFRSKGLGNQKFTSDKDLKVGDNVVVFGPFVNFKGNTPESVTNKTYLYSLNGKISGGVTPPTPSSDVVTISEKTVTMINKAATAGTETIEVDLAKQSFVHNKPVTTFTLTDGTTITFDANGETNAPLFHSKTKGVRVYKNNTITINGKKAIAKIVFTCDSFKGTNYVGNAKATVKFDGMKAIYTNVFTEATGGGIQLRVQTITITYAN